MKPTFVTALLSLAIAAAPAAQPPSNASHAPASDWPGWRGPHHDAVSTETALPERWSPAGENLAWRVPYGARSAPIVVGNRVYLQNTAGRSTNWEQADDVQERVMCLDADTGKVLWEHRISLGLSDVPPHRVGWASPAVDPETGNIYALTVAGRLVALSRDGKPVWERSLVQDFGAITTHGGRTVSPILERELVIVNVLLSGWGPWARGGNRYFAFDKRTGQTVWVASPQSRHYDTNYSTPIAADVNGMRLLLVGGTDGAVHALKALTGEPVWKYEFSKRSLNTSVVMDGTNAIVTHSEENLESNEMGMVASVDATATGDIGPAQIRWKTLGWQGGYSSPVSDGTRLYQVDNGAILGAFDLKTGARLWTHGLGTIQKAPSVLGDGKLYVGTENGRFHILKPGASGVSVLDDDLLGTADAPEPILASVAVANGRVYLASMNALYAIGKAPARSSRRDGAMARAENGSADGSAGGHSSAGAGRPEPAGDAPGAPAHVQIVPLESVLEPGGRVRVTARLFDAKGAFIREETPSWSLDGLQGSIGPDGTFTAGSERVAQAGSIKATVGNLTGTAWVRVFPPLPLEENFEGAAAEAPPRHWVNATGKFVVRDIDGTKALLRLEDQTTTRRARLFMTPSSGSDYTVEADVRAIERRRQLADVGVFAQEYGLILFGNAQRLELHPWQPAKGMTVAAPFAWKADTWYRLKLRVENLPDGTTRVQGKVWPKADPEPAAWLVEKLDRIPHRRGSAGLYADAPFGAYFDNIAVRPND